jgi:hypothetical protein
VYERLLRKTLQQPKRPAVLLVQVGQLAAAVLPADTKQQGSMQQRRVA